MAAITTDYNIQQLFGNLENNYHYVYVDSIDGSLAMRNSRWFIDLSFYIIMNGFLPMNILTTNVTLPFATINNISLNRDPNVTIPANIKLKEQCEVFQASFNIDLAGNKFFEQQITNYDMQMFFNFGYDSEIVNKTTFTNKPEVTNSFLNEWITQKQQLDFVYNNYLKLSELNGWFDAGTSYHLTSNGGYSNQSVIYYDINPACDELKKPLTYLVTLQSNKPAAIVGYRANFYYSLANENKIHEYHYDNKTMCPLVNKYVLNLDATTSYDETTKDVTTNLAGNTGFYIPIRASGYFEVEVFIEEDNYVRTYCFHKSFSFSSETYYDRTINIKPIHIDRINDCFRKMMF